MRFSGFPAHLALALLVVSAATIILRADFSASPDPETAALAARVVLLANSDDPGSLRVARHYAERRAVPARNIIALPMPDAETISRRDFVTAIWEPLMRELEARNWIDILGESNPATPAGRDSAGRTRRVITGHRIAYLVVCRGVPLRIMHDPALYRDTPPMTDQKQFRTNEGAVDGELAALALGNYEINAFVPNALFSKQNPTPLQQTRVIKVARLDGPDVDSALRLVENAIAAERDFSKNQDGNKNEKGNETKKPRACIDMGGGPSKEGNEWLGRAAEILRRAGCDVMVENTKALFGADAPLDEAAYYFGWYSERVHGPFAREDFRFPPGAVALHIHSFSAATLRSATEGWCGPFVARGVTATFGNVFEPFLLLTHRPQAIAEAFERGWRAGDAAYYALPALSWQGVFIGDPLFRKKTTR